MEYAAETIALFVKLCRVRKVNKIIAVATAAVRRALNSAQFIARLERDNGIKIDVLSGEEEAFLGYVGLVNSVTDTDGLMADLGGRCSQIGRFYRSPAPKLSDLGFRGGSIVDGKFSLQDLPTAENLRRLETFLEESFVSIPWLKGRSNLIGVGGTFRSLARIYRNHVSYVPDLTDGIIIPTNAVGEIYHMLSAMDLAARRQVPGLERARADLSVTGIGIIYKLLQVTQGSELKVSVSSIRDGLFSNILSPPGPPHRIQRPHTPHQNLIDYYNLDENHLRRVSNLAVTLFDQLQPLHGLGSWERRLLLVAGLMHELGVVISVESLEKHTLYAVLNSPP